MTSLSTRTPSQSKITASIGLGLLLGHLAEAQAQRVQLDEAFGVELVIDRVFLESDIVHAVEAVGRLAADHAAMAFEQFQADDAGDALLGLVDGGLQHLAFGREPVA